MAYLSEAALAAMGFAALGRNVRISDKAAIYGAEAMSIGDNSRIDDFCVVSGKVEIGRNVHVTPFCLLAGGTPGIVLEDFSTLAYRVSIFSQSDDYSGATMTNSTVSTRYKMEKRAAVTVGRFAIIGAGAIIAPGVTVGDGTAVGMGAVVLHSTKPWGIYVGVPARMLKERRRDLLVLADEYLQEEKRTAKQADQSI